IDLKMDTCQTAAMKINKDKVDILVDLAGYMKGGRPEICALRPAPIQVRWLGMAGTSGADFYDYLIADRIVVPKNQQPFYTEKIVHMPDCYQINNDGQVIPDLKKQRKDFGLPESGFVFASFNTAYKIDETVFSCWMRLLKKVPNSVLWLMAGSTTAEGNLLYHAKKHGICLDRIVFAAKIPKEDHLARLCLADLALDTKTVSGAATTSDALMAGVPVLTLKGGHFASRMSSSILGALELDDLITDNLDVYEKKAADLALNPKQYAGLKKRLLKNHWEKPLFQTAGFVKHLEEKYLDMFHQIPRAPQ
ncbi:MAG: hypothetical protein GY702_28920, partial [Desulfobulbaceae bacterium]|nr:hypothetical protein [Desulfobulbaceae bacterium]